MAQISRNQARKFKHKRMRYHIKGTTAIPRLNVFKSLNNLEAQLIDDTQHDTLVYASTKNLELKNKTKIEVATQLGEIMGQKIIDKGVKEIVFDRGGYPYHGRIKAFAEAVRTKGVKF